VHSVERCFCECRAEIVILKFQLFCQRLFEGMSNVNLSKYNLRTVFKWFTSYIPTILRKRSQKERRLNGLCRHGTFECFGILLPTFTTINFDVMAVGMRVARKLSSLFSVGAALCWIGVIVCLGRLSLRNDEGLVV
jgi:hypothetical protein